MASIWGTLNSVTNKLAGDFNTKKSHKDKKLDSKKSDKRESPSEVGLISENQKLRDEVNSLKTRLFNDRYAHEQSDRKRTFKMIEKGVVPT